MIINEIDQLTMLRESIARIEEDFDDDIDFSDLIFELENAVNGRGARFDSVLDAMNDTYELAQGNKHAMLARDLIGNVLSDAEDNDLEIDNPKYLEYLKKALMHLQQA